MGKYQRMKDSTDESCNEGEGWIIGGQGKATSPDARFLVSTLLVYVAKSDGSISDIESNSMIDLLVTQLRISRPEALERLSRAIMVLSNDEEIGEKLRNISQGLSVAEKNEVFDMILDVVAVDEKLDPGEFRAIAFAGQILGLSLDNIHSALRSIILAQKTR
jgi:uncharacterized tellurite resistance protein B-like protein